jgi:hypothetical protein
MSGSETWTLRKDEKRPEAQQVKLLRPLVDVSRRDQLHSEITREKPVS